jgi:hypothetical protein
MAERVSVHSFAFTHMSRGKIFQRRKQQSSSKIREKLINDVRPKVLIYFFFCFCVKMMFSFSTGLPDRLYTVLSLEKLPDQQKVPDQSGNEILEVQSGFQRRFRYQSSGT